jgi:hypothetical protein
MPGSTDAALADAIGMSAQPNRSSFQERRSPAPQLL